MWETDPSLRDDEFRATFADVWCAIPKVVFSHALDSVQNARLAEASVAEEVAAALDRLRFARKEKRGAGFCFPRIEQRGRRSTEPLRRPLA